MDVFIYGLVYSTLKCRLKMNDDCSRACSMQARWKSVMNDLLLTMAIVLMSFMVRSSVDRRTLKSLSTDFDMMPISFVIRCSS